PSQRIERTRQAVVVDLQRQRKRPPPLPRRKPLAREPGQQVGEQPARAPCRRPRQGDSRRGRLLRALCKGDLLPVFSPPPRSAPAPTRAACPPVRASAPTAGGSVAGRGAGRPGP